MITLISKKNLKDDSYYLYIHNNPKFFYYIYIVITKFLQLLNKILLSQ